MGTTPSMSTSQACSACCAPRPPGMREAKRGAMVAVSSVMGTTWGWHDHVQYNAAKSGVVGLVRGMACDLGGDGIRVNGIAPGFIKTAQALSTAHSLGLAGLEAAAEYIPLGRYGEADDIADVILFLCLRRRALCQRPDHHRRWRGYRGAVLKRGRKAPSGSIDVFAVARPLRLRYSSVHRAEGADDGAVRELSVEGAGHAGRERGLVARRRIVVVDDDRSEEPAIQEPVPSTASPTVSPSNMAPCWLPKSAASRSTVQVESMTLPPRSMKSSIVPVIE